MNYIKLDQVTNMTFYQIPKVLFKGKYNKMSNNARMTYSLLRDRIDLSIKNNWSDKYGNVYVIFSRDNLATELGVNIKSIVKYMKELCELELIKETRQGVNKPNLIYVCTPQDTENTLTGKKVKSRKEKSSNQEWKKVPCNDTNVIHTDFNDTDLKPWGIFPRSKFDTHLKSLSKDCLCEKSDAIQAVKYYCQWYFDKTGDHLNYTSKQWNGFIGSILYCDDLGDYEELDVIVKAIEHHLSYKYKHQEMYLLHNFKDDVKENRIFESRYLD